MTLAKVIADAAIEKQATDVVILDLRGLDAVTDCFVICTGDVNQQVRAIADNIQKSVKERTDDRLLAREGTETMNWVILDYVNVVAHVFKPSFREFYRLENLWGDAEVTQVTDELAPVPKAKRARVSAKALAPVKPKTTPRKVAAKKIPAKRKTAATKTTPARKTARAKTTKSKA
jgi:ribosome-associated protein